MMMVIVLLITLTLGLLYLSLQNYASVPNAYTIKYQSHHYRFKPVKHKFVGTNFNYVLHKLGDESNGSRLFKNCSDSWSILRVNPTMYLTYGYNNYDVLTNLRKTLEDRGIPSYKASSVWMLTLPMVLGMKHINNITVYYCYDGDKRHAVTVIEIHNTSFERHMHVHVIGSSDSIETTGYTHAFRQPRSFHVSPADTRQGFYKFSYTIPFEIDDGTQKVNPPRLKTTVFDNNNNNATLSAYMNENSLVNPISKNSVMNLILTQTFTNALLVRHLLVQGYILNIRKRTKIHPAPPLTSTKNSKTNPTQSDDDFGFLGFNPEPLVTSYARKLFTDALETAINSKYPDVKITISYTDKHIPSIAIGRSDAKYNISLLVRTWDFYDQLLISPNVDYVINSLTERGEDLVRISNVSLFKDILNSTEIDTRTISSGLFENIRNSFIQWLRYQSPNVSLDFPLSTKKSYLSDSWVAVFIASYVFFCWRLNKVLCNAFGFRFTESKEPWKILERIQ